MRKHWKIKGILQGILSGMPGGLALNDALQRSSGDLKNFERHLGRKVQDFRFFAENGRAWLGKLEGIEVVEVGTGWFPLLPVLLSLNGAGRIHTYDKTRHLNEELTRRGLKALDEHLGAVSEWTGEPVEGMRAKLRALCEASSMEDLLGRACIVYHAPGDAAETGLPDRSVDLVFSNSVLEHVPGEVLRAIFRETARVLKSGGVTVHGVNCGDHYAYFDSGITQVNYLQFREAEWSRWNNDLLYQNRLRPRDFQELLAQGGLEILFERRSARAGCAEAFEKMAVAEEFRGYSRDDLVCTSFDFVAKRRDTAS